MIDRPRRALQISDLMILVVAFAIAASVMRHLPPYLGHPWRDDWLSYVAFWVKRWVPPALAPISVALLLIRIRSPRPHGRRLFRQPGTIALVLNSLAYLGVGLLFVFRVAVLGSAVFVSSPRLSFEIDMVFNSGQYWGGFLIAGAWLGLAFGHALRPEAGWIDRSGTFIGVASVFYSLIRSLESWLHF